MMEFLQGKEKLRYKQCSRGINNAKGLYVSVLWVEELSYPTVKVIHYIGIMFWTLINGICTWELKYLLKT